MHSPYAVALVLDPDFGEALLPIAKTMHVWVVGTPKNRAVAEGFWASLSKPYEHDLDSGITTFDPELGSDPESQCRAIMDTIDEHHDEMSHDPPYSILHVHGCSLTDALKSSFHRLGFNYFVPAAGGFTAAKNALQHSG